MRRAATLLVALLALLAWEPRAHAHRAAPAANRFARFSRARDEVRAERRRGRSLVRDPRRVACARSFSGITRALIRR